MDDPTVAAAELIVLTRRGVTLVTVTSIVAVGVVLGAVITHGAAPQARRTPDRASSAPSSSSSSPSVVGAVPAVGRAVPGILTTRTIPGTTSHFVARPAEIWRPPILRADPSVRLPVLELLIGEPGEPKNWLVRGALVRRLSAVAAAHGGRAPIVVVVDENGSSRTDTECVTTNHGDVERYLTVDVPHWIETHLPVAAGPGNRAIGGLSEGGTCSLMLALRHPRTWSTFDDISGLARLTVGSTDDRARTIAELFGGSVAAYDAHDPLILLRRHRYPTSRGGLFFGTGDAKVAHDVRTLRPLLARAGLVTRVASRSGGHNWTVFGAGLSAFLTWWHPTF